ncbi:unnamed protein product [Chondrus crispus]|uniref:Uncharacterized protein n=1 Tax=Chondrus crispus TaxID=2769 RepID=R7Q494_CHOCR|nr:unnamed protein product [Chondrus crispus]CDF32693.1 unnamed protein product [Chondrus crispus]|eukprot:XP_005712464.1 unnamed protein product [Chondrus crispus]
MNKSMFWQPRRHGYDRGSLFPEKGENKPPPRNLCVPQFISTLTLNNLAYRSNMLLWKHILLPPFHAQCRSDSNLQRLSGCRFVHDKIRSSSFSDRSEEKQAPDRPVCCFLVNRSKNHSPHHVLVSWSKKLACSVVHHFSHNLFSHFLHFSVTRDSTKFILVIVHLNARDNCILPQPPVHHSDDFICNLQRVRAGFSLTCSQ